MKFESSSQSKVWLDIEKMKPIFIDPMVTNHSKDVVDYPEKYRLPKDFAKDREKIKYDYDGFVLVNAMRKGFVRIAIDYRNPDTNSNMEALSLGQLQKAYPWFKKFVGRLTKLLLIVRNGYEHKDATVYVLDSQEKLDFFEKYGKILQKK